MVRHGHAGAAQEHGDRKEGAVAELVRHVAAVVRLSDTRGKTMNERVPAAVAAVSAIVILAYACATAPATNPSPTPNTQQGAGQQMPGGPGGPAGPGGPRVPLTDSARRVR